MEFVVTAVSVAAAAALAVALAISIAITMALVAVALQILSLASWPSDGVRRHDERIKTECPHKRMATPSPEALPSAT